jgi:hypothetical protein
MALRTPILAGVAILGVAVAGWLYRDNRALADEVARLRAAEKDRPDPWTDGAAAPGGSASGGERRPGLPFSLGNLGRNRSASEPPPQLGETPKETRGERRTRRSAEVAAFLGRDPDESEEDYRARMVPMLKTALERPRNNVEEMRKQAEAAANVTDAQRKELDAAFEGVYSELVDFTNAAITDGQLTPYDRNVKGLLQYAGGLGAILEGAEGRVGKILSADQMRTMYNTGFEWGEYLGVRAPWEQLRAPPPRPGS